MPDLTTQQTTSDGWIRKRQARSLTKNVVRTIEAVLLKHHEGIVAGLADYMRENTPTAIPLDEWSVKDGDVLWWRFPIQEPPYCGSPLDTKWPGYHTHWTRFFVPQRIKE